MRSSRRILPLLLAATILCSASSCQKKDEFTVTKDGVGPFFVGMSLTDAQRAEPTLKLPAKPSDECLRSRIESRSVALLFEKNRLERIDILDAKYHTDKGIGIGITEKDAKKAYGSDLKETPHKYDLTGHYLSLIDASGKGFVFETDGQKITQMRTGRTPALEYVEGCG